MKPVLKTDKDITSTLDGERIEMAFDMTALAHLQEMYVNIYQDREMAVLREYSCNAFDAHVDAGITDPIEITLPSRFDPVLKIKDHGIGMDLTTLRDVYSKYGASTKRESNDVIGSFGIGCKSALTYTDQFTIQARKNGHEVIVSVSRNSKGIGELTIAYEGPTSEADGVEITIPCPAYTTFDDKAKKLFKFWPEGSVLVNGEEPVRFDADESIVHLIGDIYVQSNQTSYYSSEKSVVIMGNVAYPVELDQLGLDFKTNDAKFYHRVIAFVPIGTVEPVPAREGLTTTTDNEKALKAIGAQIKDNIGDLIASEIAKATDMLGAIKVIFEVQRHYPRVFWPDTWEYQGEEIPKTVNAVTEVVGGSSVDQNGDWVPIEKRKSTGGFVILRSGNSGKEHRRTKDLGWEHLVDCVYLTGFDLDRFTASHRRRLDQWLDNNIEDKVAWHSNYYVLTETLPDHELIDTSREYDWEDVRNTKLPRNNSGGGGVLAGFYDSLNGKSKSATTIQASSIDPKLPIYFYCDLETYKEGRYGRTNTPSRAQYANPYISLIQGAQPTAQFFALPPNRRAKFERLFPTAIEMRDEVKRMGEQWVKRLTKRQRKLLAIHRQGYTSTYKHFTTIKDRLVDPDLREHVGLATAKTDNLIMSLDSYARHVVGFDLVLKLDEVPNIMERYPLLRDLGGYYRDDLGYYRDDIGHHDHVVLYLNSAYDTFHNPITTTQGA